jgi:2-polyprenyl-3-methyl-5-hydroxy-6-metoxy-1,4-benzoquinol methylase
MMLISKNYVALNAELHNRQKSYGTSGKKYAATVLNLALMHNAKTILDYGCGKQTLKEAMAWEENIKVIGYDPAIPGLDAPPKPAEIVVCTDVMEHVENGCVQAVLDHIFKLAIKGAFFVICCEPGDRKLPNGELAHCSVHPADWWLAKISTAVRLANITPLWNTGVEVGVWVAK